MLRDTKINIQGTTKDAGQKSLPLVNKLKVVKWAAGHGVLNDKILNLL
jgi:hypothetical protein